MGGTDKKQKSTAGGLQEQRPTCIKWCKIAATGNRMFIMTSLELGKKLREAPQSASPEKDLN